MSDRQYSRPCDGVARKWCEFAERRRDYYVELYRSGRWRHYYTDRQFLDHMREVLRDVDTWNRIAEGSGSIRAVRPEQPDSAPLEYAPDI